MRITANQKSELADIIIEAASSRKLVRRQCMRIIYQTLLSSSSSNPKKVELALKIVNRSFPNGII